MALKYEVVEITPERARKLLERNQINRPIKGAAVKRYAADMAAGNWVLNGEAIIQRSDGMLLNGQNRLHACLEADVPFSTLFVSGVNGDAMDTIDTGISRSFGDQLHWKGVSSSSEVSAAVKWLYRYDYMVEHGMKQLQAPLTPPAGSWMATFDTYEPHFTSAAALIIPIKRQLPGPTGVHLFVHVLLSRTHSFEKADRFWNEVAYGSEDSAATVLKDWMLARRGPYQKAPISVTAAVEVKAARMWLKGRVPKTLLWKRPSKFKGEAFPRIDQDVSDDIITT